MVQIMIASSILLWIVVLFNLLLTVALIRRLNSHTSAPPNYENMPKLEVGTPAPDFTAQTANGETISLKSFARQALALIFISPHCAPCIEKIPTFNSLASQARRNGVELMLVSQANRVDTQKFVVDHKVQVPVLVAPSEENEISQKYMVSGTPFYCLIDEKGNVASTGFFSSEWQKLVQRWQSHTAVPVNGAA